MAKGNYMSFQELKDSVSETYSSIAQLLEKFDWGFFSEDGQNKIEAYAILDDAFNAADDHNDLVKIVSNEVAKLKKEMDTATPEEAVEKKEVVKLLVKYIRHNLEEDFWKDYPEYDKKNAGGC